MAWGDTGWQLGIRPTAEARALMAELDVAHVQHPFLSGRVALAHCRPHRIPIVFTNHTRYDLYSDTYAGWVPREVRMAYLRRYLCHFVTRIDLTIAPSASIADWLSELGITDGVVVLPNGVDTVPFTSPAKPRSRASLGLARGAVVLAYLGRLGHEKNIGVLLEAFATAAARDDRLALVLVGDGPARKEAQTRIAAAGLAERTRFLGLTPYGEVPNVLATCDAFATASVSEVHPLVVVEAMAAGLPVLGVHSPGISDTVDDGVSGLLVAEVDAVLLAERMNAIAADPALRSRLSAGARAGAARYDIRATGARLLAAYEHLLARDSRNDTPA